MAKIIAVVGATGVQGGGLARAILADPSGGFSVRAITRDPSKDNAKALAAKGAEVVSANLDDVESLKKAFAGAHGVFGVTNFWEHFSAEKEKAQAKNIADAAKAAGVKHVIWSTLEDTRKFMTADDKRMPMLQEKYRVPHFDAKAEADAYFQGLPVTFLVTVVLLGQPLHVRPGAEEERRGPVRVGVPDGHREAGRHRRRGHRQDRATASSRPATSTSARPSASTARRSPSARWARSCRRASALPSMYYHAAEADEYRGYGFPGADEMGNMFQAYRDFEKQVLGARSLDDRPQRSTRRCRTSISSSARTRTRSRRRPTRRPQARRRNRSVVGR